MPQEPTKVINGLKIDPIIFTFKFNCQCTGECCHYGVFADLKECHTVLDNKEKVISIMDESQPKDIRVWFEQPEKDEDFESGVAVGTNVVNGKCSFLDKEGLCTLQKLAHNEGVYKWKYKPLYCILFPFTVYEGALTIDDDHINRLKTCNKDSNNTEITIFEHCREELIHFLGEEGFAELEKFREEYLNYQRSEEAA